MERITADIVIAGGGIAGMTAACAFILAIQAGVRDNWTMKLPAAAGT